MMAVPARPETMRVDRLIEPSFRSSAAMLDAGEGTRQARVMSLSSAGAYACGVVRILLVEDEPLIASFVSRGLRAEGYATAVAATGDEALAEVRAREWDLVVLDLMLPGLDGF